MMLMNLFAEIDISKLFGLAIRTSIGVQAATFALAAVGLNLHYGYTGLLNFGVAVSYTHLTLPTNREV